jgi:DNA-binding beta-propeller fold protein YncE
MTVSTRTFVQIIHRPVTATAPSKSSQVAYDSTNNKVWIVNPDSDTVTRVDCITRAKDFEVSVGVNSRPASVALRLTATEAWVTCRDTGEIRILDSNTGAAIATIALGHGSAPMGLVFTSDRTRAFVACEGSSRVVKIDAAARTVLTTLTLQAAARAIAISGDSTRLFAARFISPDTQGQVWEINPTTLALVPNTSPTRQNPYTLGIDTTPDSPNGGRGLPNYLMDAALSPDGRRLWIPAKKDNIQRGTGPGKTGGALTQDNTVRSVLCQVDVLGNAEVLPVRKDVDDQGLPSAVCFSPVGDLAFVAFIANNEVLAFDTNTGNQVACIVVGLAPSGLVISPNGTRLYVHNFLNRSLMTIDVTAVVNATSSTMTSLGITSLVSTEKLAANVLQGKRIFYNASDPRMSAEGYISCASCHLDGDHDGRTWDFTDRGEGFRNNITLLGRSGMGHGRVHWTGNFNEIQDFELDIRNAFGGTGFITGAVNGSLGTANAGLSADLDAMAAYVSSLTAFPKSPKRNADGTRTAPAIAGEAHFTSKGCATCHSSTTQFTDSSTNTLHNIGTITTASGQRLGAALTGIDTPTLRGIWSTAPYLHRGQAADLPAVFNTANAPGTTNHARFRELTLPQQGELIEYMLQLE